MKCVMVIETLFRVVVPNWWSAVLYQMACDAKEFFSQLSTFLFEFKNILKKLIYISDFIMCILTINYNKNYIGQQFPNVCGQATLRLG